MLRNKLRKLYLAKFIWIVENLYLTSKALENNFNILYNLQLLHFNILIYKLEFYLISYYFLFRGQPPPVGQGLLIFKASRSHSDTRQSVGLLWTSDQLVAETSSWQHTTLTRKTFILPLGFEPAIPARTRGHWDRSFGFYNFNFVKPRFSYRKNIILWVLIINI